MLADLPLSQATVDRAAHLRTKPSALRALRESDSALAIRVHEGRLAVADDGSVLLVAASTVDPSLDLAFLGIGSDGVAFFAEHVATTPDGGRWAGLRELGPALDAQNASLAVTAVALDNWLRTHGRCPRCGTQTQFHSAGWSRRCPDDGSEHFPRTDPAVIMLVRDRDDRALLGRQGRWDAGWFSTLAGFVESGESAEAAVRREVREEVGLVVGEAPADLCYLGSQPWPFPSSLMLGFHAWTDATDVTADGDEIAEARWFSRAELEAACAAGEVRLPPRLSISRRLVERWYGSPLAGSWSRP